MSSCQDAPMPALTLDVMPGELAVCRLPPDAPVPDRAQGDFVSVTRTPGELFVACTAGGVPDGVTGECGWRAVAVRGPLAFSLTGVLASLATPLAEAGVPVFVMSTYDTDYLLVREGDVDRAKETLRAAGHTVVPWSGAS